MQDDLLVIGIDPGITTAYAILNLEGSIVKLKSSKTLNLSTLITETIEEGKILAVGTDVKIVPKFIQKYCAKVGARVFYPKEDMKVGFKTRITSPYKVHDAHQRDSLAAALFAYKEIFPLLKKIEYHLKEHGKEHLSRQMQVLVIGKGMSISDAMLLLETKPDLPVERKKRKRDKITRKQRLFEENSSLRYDNGILHLQIRGLEKQLALLERKYHSFSEAQIREMKLIKDKKINYLNLTIHALRNEIASLQKTTETLKTSLLQSHTIAIKKVPHLGADIIVGEQHILFVEDVNSFSEKTLQALKEQVKTIIYRKKPGSQLLRESFHFVAADKLTFQEFDDFILLDKEELKKLEPTQDYLHKLIEEYQEKRKEIL